MEAERAEEEVVGVDEGGGVVMGGGV